MTGDPGAPMLGPSPLSRVARYGRRRFLRRKRFLAALALAAAVLASGLLATREADSTPVISLSRSEALARKMLQRADLSGIETSTSRQLAWLVAESERIPAARRASDSAARLALQIEQRSVVLLDELRASRSEAWSAWEEAHGRAVVAMGRLTSLEKRHPLPASDAAKATRASLEWRQALGFAERNQAVTAISHAALAADLATSVVENQHARRARFADRDLRRTWARWVDDALRDAKRSGSRVIVVDKERHLVDLYSGTRLERRYEVDLGSEPWARKLVRGDHATPEGRYRVVEKRSGGQTIYYKALLIDYPNAEDVRRFHEARRRRQIGPRAAIGGLIEIHGHGGRGQDWTQGCVAMRDHEIDYVFDRVEVGTPVVIVGTYETRNVPAGVLAGGGNG